MKPPALTVYLPAEERRYLRRVAFDLGISASLLARWAAMLTARQVEERLRKGMPPARIVEVLREQAEGARHP